MRRFQQLLVGLADRPADDELIRYVSAVVRLGTARAVHFLHVLHAPHGHSAEARDAALGRARDRVREQFRPGDARVEVFFDVVDGPLEDRLLSSALGRKIDLVLVGHGKGRSGRKSLARRLAMKAPCSVWMVPEGSPPVMKHVLVPVDYSEPSADALAVAAELVRAQGEGELLSLHVYFNDAVASCEEYADEFHGCEEGLLRAFDARLAAVGVPIRPLLEEGVKVAQAVTRVAESHGVDLLVMSTRGRSRSASVLLGSVTEDVIVETRHPLLVVKHFGAKLGLLQALLHVCDQATEPRYN